MILALALAAASVAPNGTAVGVGLSEWEVAAYRPSVPVGKVRFNVTNYGEDPHDFAVRDGSGKVVARSPELLPEGQATTKFTFKKKGRYALVCTLQGHEQLGMATSIKVVKAPKRRRR